MSNAIEFFRLFNEVRPPIKPGPRASGTTADADDPKEEQRLIATLNQLPDGLAKILTVGQVIRAFGVRLRLGTIQRIQRDRIRLGALKIIRTSVSSATTEEEGISGMAEQYADRLMKFPDRVAAIVGRTFAVRGDDAPLSDDEALMKIRDLLDDLNPELIEKNKGKRPARSAR